MKSTMLKKGDVVLITLSSGRVVHGKFIYRNPPTSLGKRNGESRFFVPEFVEFSGNCEDGIVVVTDNDVRRNVTLACGGMRL
ncbi:MAG: hypothetical protein LBP58_05995 [Azoarcus sp.]|jgi:hypothetical protein|nr:hypothetical protein [Azoarcus sp.]